MELRTVLNCVHKLAGFASGRRASNYNRFETRHFQVVPVLGLPTLLVCVLRCVACPRCGTPKVENLPWADGKQCSTKAFSGFLASWPSASRRTKRPASSRPLGTLCIAPRG